MKRLVSCAIIVAALAGCAANSQRLLPIAKTDPRFDACRAVLIAQAAAWNRADLDGFAAAYWPDPRLVFAGKDHLSVGFAQMIARYRQRYPTAEAMGKLTLSDLLFTPLDAAHLSVRGRWQLSRRKGKSVGGVFLLVMRQIAANWKVVLDYTLADSWSVVTTNQPRPDSLCTSSSSSWLAPALCRTDLACNDRSCCFVCC
ncbi:MAG: nuclear transport factor 2 family protein [Deltaproteobacteria bacterium]|nr:nuclear transport factor 2 family protein [Deltaproteobacteria bacterium]